jgi:hypothetical protein
MGTSLPDFSSIHNGFRTGFANLERNKWIAFVDTEALSLKANVMDLTAETSRAQGAERYKATTIALNTLEKE